VYVLTILRRINSYLIVVEIYLARLSVNDSAVNSFWICVESVFDRIDAGLSRDYLSALLEHIGVVLVDVELVEV
jgi:hypothetical protein